MIIDVQTHVFRPDQDFGPPLLADLNRCGVDPSGWGHVADRHLATTQEADAAIVFGIQGAATGWNVPNDSVAAQVRRAPDRLIFFASVDPAQSGFEQELERCHRDLHWQGINRPWQFYNSMRLLVEYGAEHKVLFGADFPFATTKDSLTGLRNINQVLGQSGLPRIPDEVIEGIIQRDALSLLCLKPPTSAASVTDA